MRKIKKVMTAIIFGTAAFVVGAKPVASCGEVNGKPLCIVCKSEQLDGCQIIWL